MTKTKLIQRFLSAVCIGAGLAVGLESVIKLKKLGEDFNKGPYNYSMYIEHPVQQLFRGEHGYNIFYTDSTERLIQLDYYDFGCGGSMPVEKDTIKDIPADIKKKFRFLPPPYNPLVKVIKDLDNKSEGFARVLSFNKERKLFGESYEYVEIHLPRNKKISPGSEVVGSSKSYSYEQKKDIMEEK